MDELALRLGRNIKVRRKALKLTQAVLAEVVRIEEETVSRIERGKSTPSLATLDRIARALNCGLEQLVSGVSDTPSAISADLAKLIEPLRPEDRRLLTEIVTSLSARFRS
ncbi:MAG: helix-turn-helix transcriptional regulator [Burkholderiales bacterium]|nr:helix-turn-helix transcriptional regulator [Burkholderiales bacterium]